MSGQAWLTWLAVVPAADKERFATEGGPCWVKRVPEVTQRQLSPLFLDRFAPVLHRFARALWLPGAKT